MSEACAHERHDERGPTAPGKVSDDELFEHLQRSMGKKMATALRKSGQFTQILEATGKGLRAAEAAEGERPPLVSVIHHALMSVLSKGAQSTDFAAMTGALEQLESMHLGTAEGEGKQDSDAVLEGVLAQLKTLFHAEPIRLEKPKVGRNDPCPCGAHKSNGTPVKFKNCCQKKRLQKEE